MYPEVVLQFIKYGSFLSEIAFIIGKGGVVPMKLMKCCKNVRKGEAMAVFSCEVIKLGGWCRV